MNAVDSILRHLDDLQRRSCANSVFAGWGAEQLWAWQQERLRELRDALLLRLPAVYEAPAFKRQARRRTRTMRIERGLLETESQVWVPMSFYASLAGGWECAVLLLAPQADVGDQLIEPLVEQGVAVAVLTTRCAAVSDRIPPAQLAARYLRVGRTYLGCAVLDCLRAIDHLEAREDEPCEVVGLTACGDDAPTAAATMAVDKRVRVMVLRLARAIDDTPGAAPVMLGAGDYLTVPLSCCAPRPLMLVGPALPGMVHIDALARLFQHCDAADRLVTGTPDELTLSEQVLFLKTPLA